MAIEQITYTADNAAEVVAWLTARNLFLECSRCLGNGQYRSDAGVRTCGMCLAKLLAVKMTAGICYLSLGDTVAFDGFAVEIIRAKKDES